MVNRKFFTLTQIMKHYGKQPVMGLLLTLAILFTSQPALAIFNAGVNRTVIADYETLELTLRSDTDTSETPDLSLLEQDFDVLGTRQSRQMRIINGQSESWRDWIVTLMPKRTGTLTIPSLALGSERSQPVTVQIRSDLNDGSGNINKPVFLQTDISNDTAYVQQEILFTLQILYRVPLYEDSRLTPLTIDNALVQQLGETRKFDTVIDGTRYKVFDLRFSIHPQQEGTLNIPSLTFSGVMAENRDPFGSIFASGGKPIVVRTQPISINVKPRPASYPEKSWLPARNLALTEIWSQSPDNLQVGDAITRTITIEADGLSAAQLPPVFLAQPEGVNSYPDKSGSEDLQTENGIRGQRTDAIAMIPTRPGKLILPAVKYTWFDTEMGEIQVAEIPARTINVAPGANVSQPVSPVPAAAVSHTEKVQEPLECPSPVVSEPQAEPVTSSSSLWRIISLILAILWLATGFLWWRGRDRESAELAQPVTAKPVKSNVRKKQAFADLEATCKNGDLSEMRSKLKLWCIALVDDDRRTTLSQCLDSLRSEELRQLATQLDAGLYSGNSDPIDLDRLISLCRDLQNSWKAEGDSSQIINDIYPR